VRYVRHGVRGRELHVLCCRCLDARAAVEGEDRGCQQLRQQVNRQCVRQTPAVPIMPTEVGAFMKVPARKRYIYAGGPHVFTLSPRLCFHGQSSSGEGPRVLSCSKIRPARGLSTAKKGGSDFAPRACQGDTETASAAEAVRRIRFAQTRHTLGIQGGFF
jgi:hypothetical protein